MMWTPWWYGFIDDENSLMAMQYLRWWHGIFDNVMRLTLFEKAKIKREAHTLSKDKYDLDFFYWLFHYDSLGLLGCCCSITKVCRYIIMTSKIYKSLEIMEEICDKKTHYRLRGSKLDKHDWSTFLWRGLLCKREFLW